MRFFKELGYKVGFMNVNMHPQKQQIDLVFSSEHCSTKLIQFFFSWYGSLHASMYKLRKNNGLEILRVKVKGFLIQLDVYFAPQFLRFLGISFLIVF